MSNAIQQESLMLIIKLLTGLAFVGSVAWFIATPDYEPAIVSITSFSALIAILFGEERAKRRATQSQFVAENAIGIQAGGNVKVGHIHVNRDSRDAE
jgi:hypothetical protein